MLSNNVTATQSLAVDFSDSKNLEKHSPSGFRQEFYYDIL